MSRIRSIKPEFFLDDKLAELTLLARMLFVGLWTLADCEGRLEDRPKRIRAQIHPYDDGDTDAMLQSLHDCGFISRYAVGGVRYIEVRNFKKHQRLSGKEAEAGSTIPPPSAAQLQASQAVTAPIRDQPPYHQDGEATGKQRGSNGEATGKRPMSRKGRERKGMEGKRKGKEGKRKGKYPRQRGARARHQPRSLPISRFPSKLPNGRDSTATTGLTSTWKSSRARRSPRITTTQIGSTPSETPSATTGQGYAKRLQEVAAFAENRALRCP